jgi:RecA/RadA recombinase
MTPIKKEEKKKATVADKDPRELTPKERRDKFLALKKANIKSEDWRIQKSEVAEEKIPFGMIALDNAMQLGGLPRRGRVIQFHGQEHGGKSTMCCKTVANYQAQTGEPAMICDFEGTLSWNYLQAIGVDPDLAELYTPDSVQACCAKVMEFMLAGTRLFVFDSIPAMKEKIEAKEIMKGSKGKAFAANYAAHAKTMQRFFDLMIPHAKEHNCTFLMVNQVRDRIDGTREAEMAQKYPSFTNLPYILPGGRASRYLMSAMIEVNVKKAWKAGKAYTRDGRVNDWVLGPELPVNQQGDFIATEVVARVLKNKMSGGGYRGGTLWMRPGMGVDDDMSVRQLAYDYDLISSVGKKWIVGEAASPLTTYNTKADALADLVTTPNREILDRLKPLVASYIDRDKSTRFESDIDDNVRSYMEGEKDFVDPLENDDEVIVKNIDVEEL